MTRSGDAGVTGLADGSRVAKDDARIEGIGAIDEVGAAIGWLEVAVNDMTAQAPSGVTHHPGPDSQVAAGSVVEWSQWLTRTQHDLFDIGGELAMPGHILLDDQATDRLEGWTAALNGNLPPLAEFILAGGSEAAARAHIVRTTCRRAERALVTLAARYERLQAEVGMRPEILRYVNRLSDFLFVLARALNAASGKPDRLWVRDQASRAASR